MKVVRIAGNERRLRSHAGVDDAVSEAIGLCRSYLHDHTGGSRCSKTARPYGEGWGCVTRFGGRPKPTPDREHSVVVCQIANTVPGSSVSAFAPTHTAALIFWPVLIVLAAVPVPPITVPPMVSKLVVPAAHLPTPFAVVNVTFPLLVPWPLAHVIVIASVPDFVPFAAAANVPPPAPPVAAVGVHFDNEAVSLVPAIFVVNPVHCGPAAAPAGAAISPTDSTIAAANNTPPNLRILLLPS